MPPRRVYELRVFANDCVHALVAEVVDDGTRIWPRFPGTFACGTTAGAHVCTATTSCGAQVTFTIVLTKAGRVEGPANCPIVRAVTEIHTNADLSHESVTWLLADRTKATDELESVRTELAALKSSFDVTRSIQSQLESVGRLFVRMETAIGYKRKRHGR